MKKYLLILFTFFVTLSLKAEIRSLWVLPWDITSPEAVDEVIQRAIEHHQNEILVEVRYRSDALYITNRLSNDFPNPEPRSHVLKKESFDPLGYTLSKAHEHGLKVQAWVVVFNATPLDDQLIKRNYIYMYHPEWITYDSDGKRMHSSRQFGFFIDPGILAVQDYLINIFSDLASGYPELDGLHLDYARYPERRLGFHPESIRRFNEEVSGMSWNEWRTKQVTDFISKLRTRIKGINPELKLSAAVFADIHAARESYAQDWYDWLERGLIDCAYPMAYNVNFEVYRQQLINMQKQGFEDRIVLGLRAWDINDTPLLPWVNSAYNISDIYRRIELARKKRFSGIALFSYRGLTNGDAFTHLSALAYPQIPPLMLSQEPGQTILLAEAEDLALSDQPNSGGLPEESFEALEAEDDDHILADQSHPEAAAQTKPSTPVSSELATTSPSNEHSISKTAPQIESGKAAKTHNSLKVNLHKDEGFYVLDFNLPREGRWHWALFDGDKLIYDRHRYFFSGTNQDYWDGVTHDLGDVAPGRYSIIFRMDALYYQSEIMFGTDD